MVNASETVALAGVYRGTTALVALTLENRMTIAVERMVRILMAERMRWETFGKPKRAKLKGVRPLIGKRAKCEPCLTCRTTQWKVASPAKQATWLASRGHDALADHNGAKGPVCSLALLGLVRDALACLAVHPWLVNIVVPEHGRTHFWAHLVWLARTSHSYDPVRQLASLVNAMRRGGHEPDICECIGAREHYYVWLALAQAYDDDAVVEWQPMGLRQ